ncbi:hypothetical protein PIB30_059356 [Stylosanthes scabra]|uniref:Uncharacterized protein n=1 Tax=Stylosanthes scabra TaxID=79078 RepID=A0ABU6VNC9_9FABA|nr:hypothetical protein [Stylosanthes scabra]
MERWNRVCTFELGIQESTLKGSRVDSKLDRDDLSFETLQGVDSEWPKSTPAFKMSFKEA